MGNQGKKRNLKDKFLRDKYKLQHLVKKKKSFKLYRRMTECNPAIGNVWTEHRNRP